MQTKLQRHQKILLNILICWSAASFNKAQSQPFITIDTILLTGNKHTKNTIITRELDFKTGDTIALAALPAVLERNQKRLLATALFNKVEITADTTNPQTTTIQIRLQEDWYWYPLPVVELADRNFNVWWVTFNHSLRRINGGIYFINKNLTGRKDWLQAAAMLGYSQRLSLEYKLPYLNRRQTIGIWGEVLLLRNRELAYQTVANELQFRMLEDTFLLRRLWFTAGLILRPDIYAHHNAFVDFQSNQISLPVVEWNADFFGNGENRQHFWRVGYTFSLDKRDFAPYPLKGTWWSATLLKEGLVKKDDLHTLYIGTTLKQYSSLSNRWSGYVIAKARAELLHQSIPYYNSRALGYDRDYLRGYEYYVIDGQDYAFLKTALRFKAFDRSFHLGRLMPIKTFKHLPVRVFASLNTDNGYVNNRQPSQTNTFANRWLYSYGMGLDFVFYQTRVVSWEYSVNHLGEKGIYLHADLFF